jgi:nicotinamide-nucleotide amidase
LIDEKNLKIVSDLLKQKKLKIATAESCTGGLIAHSLTNISGSSEYFERGIISYSNKAKKELLAVPEEILKRYGAVSKQVAETMANNIRIKSNVDIGIATTGIAGPTGGTKYKPVGLIFISVSTKEKTIVKEFKFSGNRLQNKENTCNKTFEMLKDFLST